MKYLLEDGSGVVEAATPAELINQLKDGGRFTAEQTIQEYMDEFAVRFTEFYGGRAPRTDSPDNFIADLEEQGWLKKVE
ncbi:hypothetical protein F5984_19970 [Rudanella paleaurantiibacter]|uniref:Uncharacterized protein n=1 Tax=Rudanella paleaurantiibacter TaxID=2614655 RepID=A0A7J5TV64_9BACT|nr:hypothetical protein [Rudanella paleaurantiibacter]KAB7728034.1 hypothetical protein F5984_19970 [Rudanella paleaurantiibacter]